MIDADVFEQQPAAVQAIEPYLIDWAVAEADKVGFSGAVLRSTIDSMPRLSNVFVNEYMQIYLINAAIRRILMKSSENTMNIRMMVVDTEETEQWKLLLSLKVLPFMAAHCQ